MAAVTVAAGWPRNNVAGRFREYLYKVNIAANADYLDVPLRIIKDVHLTDDTITAVGVTSIAAQGKGSRIAFTSGGAITNCFVRVLGW